MTRKAELPPRNASLVLRSIWHWDLWVALAIGVAVAVGWFLTDFDPKWGWIVPVIGLSVTMGGLAWSRWESLRSRLQTTDYGELVRMTDPAEAEAKLPYFVIVYVSLASAFWSTGTAIVIDGVSWHWSQALLLGVTAFLAAWAALGVVTLVSLSKEHDDRIAYVKSLRETMEAAERRHKSERQRAKSPDDHRPEKRHRPPRPGTSQPS